MNLNVALLPLVVVLWAVLASGAHPSLYRRSPSARVARITSLSTVSVGRYSIWSIHKLLPIVFTFRPMV